MRYFVEVHTAGAPSERHELPEDQASFGSSPEASIRVDGSQALAVPLVILTLHPEGVTVQVPARVPGNLTFHGEATRSISVPWGEDVYVGSARLAFVAERGNRKGPSGAVVVAALFALVAGGAAILGATETGSPSSDDPVPPPLSTANTACPERIRSTASAFAKQALASARAKRERAAFDRRDGVEALKLLGEAKACFDLAGESAAATADGERAQWQRQLDEDYASLRLRLRVSLDQKRFSDALSALHGLEALLASQPSSPYRTWLAGLRRDLERRVAQAGS